MAVTTRKGHAASARRQSRQRLRSDRRYIFLSHGSLAQGTPLQTQSVGAFLSVAGADCKCLPEIPTSLRSSE